jgi:anti-sigma B factor antagonist
MHIERIQDDKATILLIAGRLDSRTADTLSTCVNEAISRAPAQLILDLGGVEYVSSAGLQVLIRSAKAVRCVHTQLALCALQANVMKMIEISGLTNIFSIYRDRSLAA